MQKFKIWVIALIVSGLVCIAVGGGIMAYEFEKLNIVNHADYLEEQNRTVEYDEEQVLKVPLDPSVKHFSTAFFDDRQSLYNIIYKVNNNLDNEMKVIYTPPMGARFKVTEDENNDFTFEMNGVYDEIYVTPQEFLDALKHNTLIYDGNYNDHPITVEVNQTWYDRFNYDEYDYAEDYEDEYNDNYDGNA